MMEKKYVECMESGFKKDKEIQKEKTDFGTYVFL